MQSANLSRDSAHSQRRWRIRKLIDTVARRIVQVGGVGVIAAIALIFIFLLSVVYPLFGSPSVESASQYTVPGGEDETTLFLSVEEQAEIALRVTQSGKLVFFDISNGSLVREDNYLLAQTTPLLLSE